MRELKHMEVPAFLLSDRNGRAMAAAIDAMLDYLFLRIARGALEVVDVDGMSEWRLDEMAWEYALPWYDRGADVARKRRVIRGMRQTLMIMGTPRAVKNVVTDYLGSTARLAEWWEYGGEPYHYRVISSGAVLEGRERRVLYAALDAARNVRSYMDEMIWAWPADGRGHLAAGGQLATTYTAREVG